MKKYEVFIVSHTHHDREWYLPFQGFRHILVKNIDLLLDILENDPRFHSFLLDAQSITIEDYLEIRPENEYDLRKWISRRKILVGPWYIQPDEFIVSGESLIRNLFIGIRIASKYGYCPKIGYVPDTFGHTIQLPQILRGFNIDNFIFHRGLEENVEKLGAEFWWESPDGSRVLTVFLRRGYCNSVNFPSKIEDALEKFYSLKKILLPLTKTNTVLLMNGCDHAPPQRNITDIIDMLNERLKDETHIKHGSLEEYIERVRNVSDKLEVYRGEPRYGRYHPILTGIWSARTYLKIANRIAEILLESYVEPLSTFAWILGEKYPSSLIEKAWKLLIRSQPHDSIGGCSIDDVHREVKCRLDASQHLSERIIADMLNKIANKINLPDEKDTHSYIIVFNTVGWSRNGVVEAVWRTGLNINDLAVFDENDREVLTQPLSDDAPLISYNPELFRGKTPINIKKLVFLAEDLPPFGYKVYKIKKKSRNKADSDIKTSNKIIENKYYIIEADEENPGAFTIIDKMSGRVLRKVNLIEDDGDAGDEYDYSPPSNNKVYYPERVKSEIRIVEHGPVRARMNIKFDFMLPVSLTKERTSRSNKLISNPITIDIILYSNSRRIDIITTVENNSRDHRFRIVFPADFKTDKVSSQTHYYVIERSVDEPSGEGWIQKPMPTKPQLNWSSLTDGKRGITIVNIGLPEFEVRNRDVSQYILTLFRSVGWLSRSDLLTRRGNAGPSIPTPEAQCLGRYIFKYSIILHEKDWLKSKSYKDAREFIVPPISIIRDKSDGNLPLKLNFIDVDGENIIVSALKKADGEKALILRLDNLTRDKVNIKVDSYKKILKMWETNLLEENIREINRNPIGVDKYKIYTIKMMINR